MSRKDRECNNCDAPLFDQDPEELTNLCDECVKLNDEDEDWPLN